MFPTWVLTIVLIGILVVVVFMYAGRRRRATTTDEMKKPRAIRRGKHINE